MQLSQSINIPLLLLVASIHREYDYQIIKLWKRLLISNTKVNVTYPQTDIIVEHPIWTKNIKKFKIISIDVPSQESVSTDYRPKLTILEKRAA